MWAVMRHGVQKGVELPCDQKNLISSSLATRQQKGKLFIYRQSWERSGPLFNSQKHNPPPTPIKCYIRPNQNACFLDVLFFHCAGGETTRNTCHRRWGFKSWFGAHPSGQLSPSVNGFSPQSLMLRRGKQWWHKGYNVSMCMWWCTVLINLKHTFSSKYQSHGKGGLSFKMSPSLYITLQPAKDTLCIVCVWHF